MQASDGSGGTGRLGERRRGARLFACFWLCLWLLPFRFSSEQLPIQSFSSPLASSHHRSCKEGRFMCRDPSVRPYSVISPRACPIYRQGSFARRILIPVFFLCRPPSGLFQIVTGRPSSGDTPCRLGLRPRRQSTPGRPGSEPLSLARHRPSTAFRPSLFPPSTSPSRG
jgi:hypothetical protein